jgi:hypothetical protein
MILSNFRGSATAGQSQQRQVKGRGQKCTHPRMKGRPKQLLLWALSTDDEAPNLITLIIAANNTDRPDQKIFVGIRYSAERDQLVRLDVSDLVWFTFVDTYSLEKCNSTGVNIFTSAAKQQRLVLFRDLR